MSVYTVKPRNIMKFQNILLKISKVISIIVYYKSLSIAHYVAEGKLPIIVRK